MLLKFYIPQLGREEMRSIETTMFNQVIFLLLVYLVKGCPNGMGLRQKQV